MERKEKRKKEQIAYKKRNNKFLKTYQIALDNINVTHKRNTKFLKTCTATVQKHFATANSLAATVKTNKNKTSLISKTTKTPPKT